MTLNLQTRRRWLRSAFFVLFVTAPPLDIFRYDLTLGHFILFGQPWTLGIDALAGGEISSLEGALNLLWRAFLPLFAVVGGGLWIAWKYGRLYCGWLCPHFSVVETINALMRRAGGRHSLWDKAPQPGVRADPRYWWLVGLAVIGFAFLWALALLTYLLPPFEIYHNLLHGELTRNQALFLGVGTFLLSIEFMFARHLFCRFACAVGLFQSLAWMGNRRALEVRFDTARAKACANCNNACDHVCPMRLKPRTIKRAKFTCTQCVQCIQICENVQSGNPQGGVLHWKEAKDIRESIDEAMSLQRN